MARITSRIGIDWDVELPGGGHATVTDESPAMGRLDPEDVSDIVAEVGSGLGIDVVEVTPVATRGKEAAAWAVQHVETGAFGRMAVVAA
ncbi:MAG: hypothetical protein ACRDJC_10580 [Thermomicrobiales bacterium]